MTDASPRLWQRAGRRVAASRPGSWLLSHTLHRVDRALLWLSGGRVSIPGAFAGLPVVALTTTGAKTGRQRTVPVVGIRDGEAWILVASNWGRDRHPAWYHNLRANPEVTLTVEGEPERYVARPVTGDEREAYWNRVSEAYVGFDLYRRRADREIPVVVLRPAEGRG